MSSELDGLIIKKLICFFLWQAIPPHHRQYEKEEGSRYARKPVAIQSSARAYGRHEKRVCNGVGPLPGLEGGCDNIAGTGFGADRGLWTPLEGGFTRWFCVLCGCGALHFSYPALASAKTGSFNN